MISTSEVGIVLSVDHGIISNRIVLSCYIKHRAIDTVCIERIINKVLHVLAVLSLVGNLNSLQGILEIAIFVNICIALLKHLDSPVSIVNREMSVPHSGFLI